MKLISEIENEQAQDGLVRRREDKNGLRTQFAHDVIAAPTGDSFQPVYVPELAKDNIQPQKGKVRVKALVTFPIEVEVEVDADAPMNVPKTVRAMLLDEADRILGERSKTEVEPILLHSSTHPELHVVYGSLNN